MEPDPALVDFGLDAHGGGRRLERLGGILVDRPLAHATGRRHRPEAWAAATATYQARSRADAGPPASDPPGWVFATATPQPWQVRIPLGPSALLLHVRPAASGQLGVFLEQAPQWAWLRSVTSPGATMLSLFGHSGAATLAMAAAGTAEVVHVDASRQALALARDNAAASGLAAAVVRWVRDDAGAFVQRQRRRVAAFSGAVLDPPSWGHGPGGRPFAIDRDLIPLLDDVVSLVAAGRRRAMPPGPLLLTCHSPGWHHRRLAETLQTSCRRAGLRCESLESGPLGCSDLAGRRLELGHFARCLPRS
jgi:23S rRNA (cytosine1962-C5)-methyltransferase